MKLHILSAHLSMHEMTRRGGCKILVLHISFRLCNRRPVTPHPFVWPTPARCVLLDKGSAVFDERFLIVSDWSWKRGEKEKDEKRDRKKKNENERCSSCLDGCRQRRQFFGPSSVHTRAGGNTNAGSYASCAIDLSLAGSCFGLYSTGPGHSKRR